MDHQTLRALRRWLFCLGFFLGLPWLIGVFWPCCRHPRFPARTNKLGWVANLVGEVLSLVWEAP